MLIITQKKKKLKEEKIENSISKEQKTLYDILIPDQQSYEEFEKYIQCGENSITNLKNLCNELKRLKIHLSQYQFDLENIENIFNRIQNFEVNLQLNDEEKKLFQTEIEKFCYYQLNIEKQLHDQDFSLIDSKYKMYYGNRLLFLLIEDKQQKFYNEINNLFNIKEEYQQIINEIHRRNQFKKKIQNKINQLNRSFTQIFDDEKKERSFFLSEKHSPLLLHHFSFLTEKLSSYQFDFSHFEENLPFISQLSIGNFLFLFIILFNFKY